MKIKDIVNRDVVNLENCEDEAIHIPGLIQPHGFLISIDADKEIINVCSENISQFLDYRYDEILGKRIDDILGKDFKETLREFKSNSLEKKTVFRTYNDQSYALTIHKSQENIIFEAEPNKVPLNEEGNLFESSKRLLSSIEDTNSLKELSQSVATAIKNITGYDRVMIYKFDHEYNGEVYAEVREEHLEPFLGLHYPHTDIPPQARALYIKNLLRIIGDIDYVPAKLYTFVESKVDTLDLSLSVLRSVSPIHVEYLKNMGVGATLTVSLIHKGKLWGLVACHHYSTKFLSQETRNAVKLYGYFITSQIDVRILNEQYEVAKKANEYVDKLSSKNSEFKRDSLVSLFQDDAIYQLCNGSGFSACIDGKVYSNGETPTEEDIRLISEVLFDIQIDGNLITSTFPRQNKGLGSVAEKFPGINFHMLDDTNYLMWFREPTIKNIKWAGDPSKAIEKDKKGLSPRKSFETFTENVKDTSKPWLQPEIDACNKFKFFFQSFLRAILTNEDKEKQRILTENLKAVNSELENIGWISAHDLQEPLRKIRMMASTMLEDQQRFQVTEAAEKRISRMSKSAERMQTLIKDILEYNRASSEEDNFEKVDLNDLLQEIKKELKETLEEEKAELVIEGHLPEVSGLQFLIKQCLLNPIHNAIKFKHPDRKLQIRIFNDQNHSKSDMYSVISIQDNGIGFDNQHNEKIFKIFSRLHSKSDYEGTGIGLAFCKKIMLKHRGFIDANGRPNEGAAIRLYFPKVS
ncbi:MAG: histidine kinase [Pseudozobellia sp.]|nr:histidine kinase [Pseudozobellia sp.]|tara:strand:+ start:687 stop:2933 length:2247 start_codon:yes stop_codon:yes gene_type:complete